MVVPDVVAWFANVLIRKSLSLQIAFIMFVPSTFRKLVVTAALFAFGCVLAHPQLSRTEAAEVQVGIHGHYRVGHWTAIHVTDGTFDELQTRDGDGVEVRYGKLEPESEWGYAIPGSEAAPLLVLNEDASVVSMRFPTVGSPSRGPAMIPLETPWIVVLGDPLGVDEIGYNEILDRDAAFAVSQPDDSASLPDASLGYDGVDLMMIGGSGIELLRGLNTEQQQAIKDWVVDGGRLFVTLGESAPEVLNAAPWLQDLLPVDEVSTETLDPVALETFMSSTSRLAPFAGLVLPLDAGNVLLPGRTNRRVSVPLAVEYNVGFGRLTVVTADLESELFASWPNRLEMVTRLTGSILLQAEQKQTTNRKSRPTAFDDLAGQLRLALDQFQVRRAFGFSIVSLILMALIALIGPLDYLLINRVLGKPLLGWLSFPIVTIGLSAVLISQAGATVDTSMPNADSLTAATTEPGSARSETDPLIQCNRIEFFDLDTIEGIGRGFSANYLYSQRASSFDVEVTPGSSLTAISGETPILICQPFGYPGQAFGGIQIGIEDSRLPVYSIEYARGEESDLRLQSTMRGLPLASRSSKGLSVSCRFVPDLPDVSLEHRPGSELLQGELINPLPVDLLDGMLVYRNWAYLLPTRFPAGSSIGSVDSLRQKNFRWQLSRQRALESASESEAWDPTSTALDRIAEMVMFHGAVGGDRYTALKHGPLQFLDLSHVLASDRCLLIGRVEDPLSDIRVENVGESNAQSPSGTRLSLMRVVIPVLDVEND